MSKQLYTVSKEGLEYLCGLINKIVTLPSDVISDITLSTNKTMSSVKIDKIIKQCLQDANEYSNEVVNSLTHLVAEKIDFEPTLDNTTDKINTLLLYSSNSDNNYTQYLRLTNELLNLGDTSLSLNEYIKEVDADTKYTLKTTTDTLTTEVTNIKSDFTTHKNDADIHTSATEKASYVKKTDITTTIDGTSTDDEVPSARAILRSKSAVHIDESINPENYKVGEWFAEGNGSTFLSTSYGHPCSEWHIGYIVTGYETSDNTGYKIILAIAMSGNCYVKVQQWNKWTKWINIGTTSVADVPLTRIPTNKNITNYEIVNNNGSSSYIVRDGICAVSLCIKCNSVSAGWIDCFNAMPRPYLSNGIHFSVSNMYNTDAKPIFIKVIGNMLQVRQGSVTSGANSYYISFSYPVAES